MNNKVWNDQRYVTAKVLGLDVSGNRMSIIATYTQLIAGRVCTDHHINPSWYRKGDEGDGEVRNIWQKSRSIYQRCQDRYPVAPYKVCIAMRVLTVVV